MNPEEQQYLDLIKTIIENGSEEISRNGKVYSIFGNMMRFSLEDGKLPLLTQKSCMEKTCFKELFWFIKGSTSNHELKEQNVHIWDANASREFLDSRNLNHEENDLGPVYGHQWRHFNASYENCHSDYKGKGIDQLHNVIEMLKDPEQRTSRRMIVSAWNPCQIDEMALPPCHIMFQFYVRKGKYLSCSMYQRSGDVGLGVPFNIASYSCLTHIIAKHCGLIPDEFVYFLGNAHIYEEHIEPLKEQIQRLPYDFPQIKINKVHDNIEEYTLDDIKWITEYNYHKPIKMNMVA